MAARGSTGAGSDAAPPAGPPGAGAGAQQRRNSYAGWPQSIFGIPSAARAPGAAASVPQPTGLPHPSTAPIHPMQGGAASLPDGGMAAYPSIGLFRRLSLSQAPTGAQQQQQPAPSLEAMGLSAGVSARLQALQHKDAHPLPRALDEVRAANDTPPSRPDSRMRNLMLSGQFLV
ncbi:hypothetical protein IWQ56_001145 [Coemansia nantahalensis]|nr:hypothetical protein IWQ56_001145 [Coemansia nantahalensis]